MSIIDLGIDMGSCNTTLFQYGYGIVLKEPTMIALREKPRKREIVATGTKAKRLFGKVSSDVQVISPVRDGVIVNAEGATLLLKDYLSRLMPDGFIKPRIRALVSVPCGLSLAERKNYESVMQKAGINEVTLIDTPITISRLVPQDGIFVSIGGGVSDVALVANNDIIDGATLNVAGDSFNNAITDYLYDKQNVRISQATVEKIKLAIASLYPNDTANIEIIGRDVDTAAQRTFTITATEVGQIILPLVKKIADVVTAMLSYAPPEVAEAMSENGIYLCGGSSLLPGICEYFANTLNLKVTLLDDPASTVINALGLLCGEREKVANMLNLKKM